MNLYEFEGKQLFEKHGIKIPRGIVVRREEKAGDVFSELNVSDVVVKAQVLSGKRGKNNGIRFCNKDEGVLHVQNVVDELFSMNIKGQYVTAVRIEEKLNIAEEHYMSITYDTNRKQPMLIYSKHGGVDIEDVSEENIEKYPLEISNLTLEIGEDIPYAQELWNVFLQEDCRQVEINPL
ncbi:MAG: hypothetical protein COX83_04775, partial [Candidatus Magasanikbacteria bacterium CG_4_10_14_0_2_um_filter_41_31]